MEQVDYTDTALIIAAGGTSRRFGTGENKLLRQLNGLPVICHTLKNFLSVLNPDMVVVVVPEGNEEQFRRAFAAGAVPDQIDVEKGGYTRQESVLNGLRELPERAQYVAIQDGARPFTSVELLTACLKSARQHGSGVAARKVTDTIKIAEPGGRVVSTPDRDTLWATETPQVFKTRLIHDAYEKAVRKNLHTTDDAQVAELAGHDVYLVAHYEDNRKITFVHDLPV